MSRTAYRASAYAESSAYTESSVPSTVWGPGTLAGRAILALGEATLKGLDRIVDLEGRAIQRRLAAIRASVPELSTEMYSDLIELARPGLYPEDILEVATDILFQQIDLGYTASVVLSVAQLTLSEARLVLLRLFTSRDSEFYDDQLSPIKVLDLLTTLLQLQPSLALACFDVLDILDRTPSMCLRLLDLRSHPALRAHAEDRLHIPQICLTPLSELQLRFSQDPKYRWWTWRQLELAGHSAVGRVLQLDTVLLHAVAQQSYATPEFFDAAVDMFDIICYSQLDLQRVATNHLIACISMARHSWEPLTTVLTSRPHYIAHIRRVLEANPQLCAFLLYADFARRP
ncbi:hypothetical protein DFH09DRAFT_1292809 [Mycena vulgaris]|nr:hypothetical protein DFH09DRAFT_1292809 [Mycena vulgaris]